MELFKVVQVKGNKVVAIENNKMAAKAIRDAHGGFPDFKVSRGKDNLPSPTGVPWMRRQPVHCRVQK